VKETQRNILVKKNRELIKQATKKYIGHTMPAHDFRNRNRSTEGYVNSANECIDYAEK